MRLQRTLAIPIIGLLTTVAISTLLIGYYINIHALKDALLLKEMERSKSIHLIIQSIINSETHKLSQMAALLKHNHQFGELLASHSTTGGDDTALKDPLGPLAASLDDEFLELTDASGKFIYSSQPQRRIGNEEAPWGLDEAMAGKDTLATGKDEHGWSMRAFAPVYLDHQLVGVGVVGMMIDDKLARKIATSTHTEILLARMDELVAYTMVPYMALVDQGIIMKCLVERVDSTFVQDQRTGTAIMYTRLKVVDETFCLVVFTDISSMYAQLDKKRGHLLNASLIVLIVAFLLGSACTIYLINPLKRLKNEAEGMIEQFADDHARSAVEGNEIQTLVQAFHLMSESVGKHIAKRAQWEEALREQLHLLQTLIDAIPDPIFYKDVAGGYLGCNAAFEHSFGLRRTELVGKSVYEVWPGSLAVVYDEADQELLRNPGVQEYEATVAFSDGTRHDVIVHKATFSKAEGILGGLVGSILDITERKRGEEERIRLVTAIEQVAEVILITDRKGIIQYANPAFEQITGDRVEEITGRHLRMLRLRSAQRDPSLFRALTSRLARGETWSGRFVGKREDGANYEVEAMISPVRGQSGDIINYVVIGRDVTHETRLEKQLIQAQKMEAIGTLAGGIAHDFNNILSVILGYSELVWFSTPKGSRSAENLGEVLKACERAKQLVQQILTFSRQSEPVCKPVQLSAIVREALKLLRASLPSTIDIRQRMDVAPQGTDVILADSTQIHQVLMNLGTNASHAMSEHGGILEVAIALVDFDTADLERPHDLTAGTYVRLTVSDTGVGMDAAVMQRIFEPYFTTKKAGQGTGLGLAVVHGIVKSNGGVIAVRSEPGKGTTFEIFFPRLKEEIAQERRSDEALPRGTERVLLVDDEPQVVSASQQMLEILGYQVEGRTSSVEALELFRREAERFDLVITDQTMPQLTGMELAGEILRIRPNVPILLCTGFSEAVTEEDIQASGIRRFLLKPLIMREFAETLRQLLDESQPGP